MKVGITQNKITLVDKEDLNRVSQHSWCFDKDTGYAVATVKSKKISLHRFIMLEPKDKFVDHINFNKLDNRKKNLRICTPQESVWHTNKQTNNTSGYKGVSWAKRQNKWHAQIFVNYKNIHLGFFNDKLEAVKAYNKGALKYHGQFALINKI